MCDCPLNHYKEQFRTLFDLISYIDWGLFPNIEKVICKGVDHDEVRKEKEYSLKDFLSDFDNQFDLIEKEFTEEVCTMYGSATLSPYNCRVNIIDNIMVINIAMI